MIAFSQTVICASKYFTAEVIRTLYQKGIRHFGENRVQQLLEKKEKLKDLDIIWHLIGPLQTNKVKQVINEIEYLHTLDRISLAKELVKHLNRPIKCFIQVNMTRETQKNGILPEKLDEFLLEIKNYDKINVIGLMTIGMQEAPLETEKAFKELQVLGTKYHLASLSMGMTDDYPLAIKYGATHLRIGRLFQSYLKE